MDQCADVLKPFFFIRHLIFQRSFPFELEHPVFHQKTLVLDFPLKLIRKMRILAIFRRLGIQNLFANNCICILKELHVLCLKINDITHAFKPNGNMLDLLVCLRRWKNIYDWGVCSLNAEEIVGSDFFVFVERVEEIQNNFGFFPIWIVIFWELEDKFLGHVNYNGILRNSYHFLLLNKFPAFHKFNCFPQWTYPYTFPQECAKVWNKVYFAHI